MSIINDFFDNLPRKEFPVTLLSALLLFAPGISILFQYKSDIFTEIDTLKIILLSVAIMAPFLFTFWALVSYEHHNNHPDGEDFLVDLFQALVYSGLVIYVSQGISYGFGLQFKSFVSISLSCLLLGVVQVHFLEKRDRSNIEIERINLEKAEELEQERLRDKSS